MFIGREKELAILRSRYDSDGLEVGVVYGQRRIGKTFLIVESLKEYNYIYFLAKDTTYQDNLNYFTSEYRKHLNFPYPMSFNSFDELFDAIKEEAKSKKLVLVIDELPFLAKTYPGIISYMQGFIDECKRNGTNIKIIFSGSDISFFADLLSNKAKPLYQRVSFRIHVLPMLFSDASKMLDGFSNEEKVKYLSIFGRRPYYLDKLKKNMSFRQNIVSLCFSEESILTDAPNLTLPIGYANNGTYTSIFMAISNRKRKVKDIADYLHIESNATSTYIKRMVDGESIEKRETFNGSQKTNYYEISDPFIRFYYKFIFPNYENIQRHLGEDVFLSEEKGIEEMISHGFEDVVNSFMDEINQKHKLGNVFDGFKKYTADNSSLGRSIEIDGLAESLDGKELIVIEAKYRNKNVSLEILDHLKESVSIFADRYRVIRYYVFSKTSFSDELSSVNKESVTLISLNDMFSI